jgi:hypothetical protein
MLGRKELLGGSGERIAVRKREGRMYLDPLF